MYREYSGIPLNLKLVTYATVKIQNEIFTFAYDFHAAVPGLVMATFSFGKYASGSRV